MKKYQQLRSANLNVAKAIYAELKSKKVLSQKEFRTIFWRARNFRVNYAPIYYGYQNYITVIQFLLDHELMTIEIINGFNVYAATQKCVRTKNFENATIEYVEILNEDIDKAILYQKLNNGLIPVEMEAKVICNIIKLPIKSQSYFIKMYVDLNSYFKELNANDSMFLKKEGFPRKMEILSTLREMKNVKKV